MNTTPTPPKTPPAPPAVTNVDHAIARVLAGPAGPQVGAFFDFDGTMIDGYSAAAYITDRLRRREANWSELAELVSLIRKKDELTDDEFLELIRRGVRDWKEWTEEQLQKLWLRLFQESIADAQFPEAWRLVQAHRRMGHTIAVASSATTYQIQPLAQEWRIEHILCTRPQVQEGRLTGELVGEPAWGAGKAEAVRRFTQERGIRLDDSYGYANGNEDIAFLESVGRPTAVNPKPALAALAQAQHWPVLQFAPRRRAPLLAVARSLGAYGAMALSFATGLGLAKATGKTRRAVDLVTSIGSELGLAIAGIDIEVIGEEHLWTHRPAVFLLNHQSRLDFFVMMYLARRGVIGIAGREIEDSPGFGSFLRMADIAFIDRSEGRQALNPVVEKIRQGLSLCMSAEGTRSWSPRIGPFRRHAFHIAMQAGVPVIPVVIRNASEMMTRSGQTFRPGKLQVAVLPPISVSDWKPEELDQRIAQVRQCFIDTLEDWPGSVAEWAA